jgi:hypothetical protein
LPEATAVSHALLSTAVHVQVDDEAVIVRVPLPPAPAIVAVIGETVKVQLSPAWVIVTDLPATTTVVDLDDVAVLARTLTVAVPLPVPVAPEETEVHVADSVAAQAQPVVVVTFTVTVPPSAGTDADVGEAV